MIGGVKSIRPPIQKTFACTCAQSVIFSCLIPIRTHKDFSFSRIASIQCGQCKCLVSCFPTLYTIEFPLQFPHLVPRRCSWWRDARMSPFWRTHHRPSPQSQSTHSSHLQISQKGSYSKRLEKDEKFDTWQKDVNFYGLRVMRKISEQIVKRGGFYDERGRKMCIDFRINWLIHRH